MLKPDQFPEGALEETEGAIEARSPSFEELMMLVFSGPMCFECLEGAEDENMDGKETEIRAEKENGEQS